ncbi:hypothetical protein LXL04_009524 [Taraxacum kok-saghyz]
MADRNRVADWKRRSENAQKIERQRVNKSVDQELIYIKRRCTYPLEDDHVYGRCKSLNDCDQICSYKAGGSGLAIPLAKASLKTRHPLANHTLLPRCRRRCRQRCQARRVFSETLSIGGRLTLIKSVPLTVLKTLETLRARFFWGADVGERKLHWVRWDRVLSSIQDGGLGVGSLFSFNRAMLFKWWWRFFHSPNLLWVKVVKSIYGSDGGRPQVDSMRVSKGPWSGVLRMLGRLRVQELDLVSMCPKRLGNGESTNFWHDRWLGGRILAAEFPRVYALDSLQSISVGDRVRVGWSVVMLRRPPRGGAEQEQWECFLEFVRGFHCWPRQIV